MSAALLCPGCNGDGASHYDDALPGERCDWCGGTGTYVRQEPTDAEVNERHRFATRLLTEPGFEMAVRFRIASFTAAPPAADPANRTAMTAVGSPCLTDETHGPAA